MRITQEDQIALHEAAFKLESVTPAQIAEWLRAIAVHPTGRAFPLPPFPGSSSSPMIPFETLPEGLPEGNPFVTTSDDEEDDEGLGFTNVSDLCRKVERRLGVDGIFSGSSRSVIAEMIGDPGWNEKHAIAFVNDVGRPTEGEPVRTWQGFIYTRVKDFKRGWF